MIAIQTKTASFPSVRHTPLALSVALLALLLISATALHAATLPDDPALAKPVTLAVKGEALTDVLGMMQEQTGVRLRVERDIADQKATIFVDKKPLRDVMNGLVTVFGYRWSQEGPSSGRSYRLWEDEKTRRDREDQRQKAFAKAWERANAVLGYMSQFSQTKSDELEPLIDKLSAEYARKHDDETRLKLAAARNLSDDPKSGVTAWFYQALPESVKNTIKSGLTVHYDSASTEPEWKVPEDVAVQFCEVTKSKFIVGGIDGSARIGEDQDDWKLDGVNLGYSAIITNESAGLDAAVFIRQKITTTTPASGQTPPTTTVHESALSTAYSLSRERVQMADMASAKRLPRKQDGALVAMKVSFDIQDIVQETGIALSATGAPANRSDILAILHEKLGLQIISDHYSQWCSWTAEKTRNVEEFLPVFGQMYKAQHPAPSDVDWGWDGQYCFLRSMDAGKCDMRETPNRLLRGWQAAYVKNGFLWLDELGQISLLTNEQVAVLQANARYLGLGDEIVVSKELRMYGRLSTGQRTGAFGEGINVADMTPEQRSIAADAFLYNGRWMAPDGRSLVGIYKNGVRIDKPEQADNPYAPATIRMTLTGAPYIHHFRAKNQSGPGFSKMMEAETSEEAWKKVLAEMPDAKEKLDCYQQRRFSMIVTRAQGASHKVFTNIPVCTPYSEPAKSGGGK